MKEHIALEFCLNFIIRFTSR